ncbi:Glycosyl transferase family 2 [Quadrisphaera granulorum]|uniref:Glycosyl transferase family 2 n=1 Tax=Quadrisphaera granulorum TaxID=317664 RepID=A0A316A907_9ACTN|nr:glycosyltransferase family 2 protein [Quadrisphaera granulorum]PWJ53698.1 glycosyl transferase family 2 [Quadrisphaera granulorum]SZE96742.1 Glycosyl transferase family 2 [Quadrisphaera granulorum]
MSAAERLVRAGSAVAVVVALHTAVNAALLRRPLTAPPPVAERVSVLLPVRDEAHQVGGALAAALASTGVPDLEVLVLDDGSRDGTAATARDAADGDPRVRLLTGAPLAPGWLGKPHALAQLAAAASGSVLVCLDADVRLAPHALAATVDLLRRHRLDLVSPYPRQLALTPAERLVQPLLQWSWLATLPLRLAERSARPSLSAANGQLMALDAAALVRAGGFAAVKSEVLDDVALVRAIKAVGGRGGVADGTDLATCRMYDGWPALRDGYAKSLWSASGSPAGAALLVGLLGAVFVLPAVAALTGIGSRSGRWVGVLGYAAGVASRVIAARRTGGRAWPDALAHPVSVAVLCGLVVRSWRLRRSGGLSWKGRALP